jgi:hypothetical protein
MLATTVAGMLLLAGGPTLAQEMLKQIELTDKQVDGFISAQKDMAALSEKIYGPQQQGKDDPPPSGKDAAMEKADPKVQAQLEAIAKRHGFKDFSQYDDVAANIAMIMSAIDPQTKKFLDGPELLKRQIADINDDKTIPAADKPKMIEEAKEAAKSAPPIKSQANIKLIEKYYDKIDSAMQ